MKPRHTSGFSLIELALVLAMMVTLGAIALPRYASAGARYRADIAARRIAADLDLARSTAHSRSSACTVIFHVPENRYVLSGVASRDGNLGEYSVQLSDPPYLATIRSASFAGKTSVTFDGWGVPRNAGSVTLSVGRESRQVALTRPAGEVSIQ